MLPERAQQCATRRRRTGRRRAADVLETPAGLSFALSNHPFYAALAGLGWFLWRRSMLGTIVVGMLVFTGLRLIF